MTAPPQARADAQPLRVTGSGWSVSRSAAPGCPAFWQPTFSCCTHQPPLHTPTTSARPLGSPTLPHVRIRLFPPQSSHHARTHYVSTVSELRGWSLTMQSPPPPNPQPHTTLLPSWLAQAFELCSRLFRCVEEARLLVCAVRLCGVGGAPLLHETAHPDHPVDRPAPAHYSLHAGSLTQHVLPRRATPFWEIQMWQRATPQAHQWARCSWACRRELGTPRTRRLRPRLLHVQLPA